MTPLPDGGSTRTLIERDGKPVRERRRTTRSRPRARTSRRSAVATTRRRARVRDRAPGTVGGRDVIVVTFAPKPGA